MIDPIGYAKPTAEDAAAYLADEFLFVPPRPELRGRPIAAPSQPSTSAEIPVDGWTRALRHDRASGAQWRRWTPGRST